MYYAFQETIIVSNLNLCKANDKCRSLYFLILRLFPNIRYKKSLSIQVIVGPLQFKFNSAIAGTQRLFTFTSNFLQFCFRNSWPIFIIYKPSLCNFRSTSR